MFSDDDIAEVFAADTAHRGSKDVIRTRIIGGRVVPFLDNDSLTVSRSKYQRITGGNIAAEKLSAAFMHQSVMDELRRNIKKAQKITKYKHLSFLGRKRCGTI